MQLDLFENLSPSANDREILAEGATVLRGQALDKAHELLEAIGLITTKAPFRHLITPGGYRMSVAMTNCGQTGWVSDRCGYRYQATDPHTGQAWPAMPECFTQVAIAAAEAAGYRDFHPVACLINRYVPGARLSLHQDKDEGDLTHPIVSVSLGLPAVFQFGGGQRKDKPRNHLLQHGDVAVWGGPSRLCYHGILPLKEGQHPLLGRQRLNLTFRVAR